MKDAYLQITYRNGRPLAAYYFLPRGADDRSAKTEKADGGFIIDYNGDGRAIGIEVTSPSQFDVRRLNEVLARLGFAPAPTEDFAPLSAV